MGSTMVFKEISQELNGGLFLHDTKVVVRGFLRDHCSGDISGTDVTRTAWHPISQIFGFSSFRDSGQSNMNAFNARFCDRSHYHYYTNRAVNEFNRARMDPGHLQISWIRLGRKQSCRWLPHHGPVPSSSILNSGPGISMIMQMLTGRALPHFNDAEQVISAVEECKNMAAHSAPVKGLHVGEVEEASWECAVEEEKFEGGAPRVLRRRKFKVFIVGHKKENNVISGVLSEHKRHWADMRMYLIYLTTHEDVVIMAERNIIFLNQLDASKKDIVIKVRIMKIWKLPSFKIPNATHSIEMILMDEEGTKIQATVPHNYFVKIERFLVEKDCLLIGRPVIGDNISNYRIIDHPRKLFLDFQTHVSKCNEFNGSYHGFTFISFDLLRSNVVPNESTVDVLGFVYTYFPMHDHKTKVGKMSKKMNLQIRDLESRSIFVTLWESYAEKMSKFLSKKHEDDTAVMILQFGRFTFSEGRAYVSSSFQGSHLYINEDMEEIKDFKKSLLLSHSNESSSSKAFLPSQMLSNMQDDIFTQSTFNTIAQDDTFDMIQVPNEINNLVGKKFVFKIDITNFNITNNYKSFTINKCTDDPVIISKLEKNLEFEEVENSDCTNIRSIDFGSQDTVNFKDSISFTDDNETPISLLEKKDENLSVIEKKGKKITHMSVKRNLLEVYDLDESPKESATKQPKTLIEGPEPKLIVKPELLIPKIEK
ncbi:hypothetical protein E3N88_29595 [Mikania micrantha]|uniref:Uncharacterized protein n=1 Tax=Mikania micrantha TaxID=192012 RepID=A0A5N6MK03_9ASTR|nr:hypothetical protein E3N88_29595 [Mikania micrantha]